MKHVSISRSAAWLRAGAGVILTACAGLLISATSSAQGTTGPSTNTANADNAAQDEGSNPNPSEGVNAAEKAAPAPSSNTSAPVGDSQTSTGLSSTTTPKPSAPPAQQNAAASSDDLLAQLEAAAAMDQEERTKTQGSAAVYAEREQQDPANLLGKELLGNETNPSLSLILDVGYAYFSSDKRVRMGGHAPTSTGPVLQGGELGASASVDPYFRVDLAYSFNHNHIEEFYLTTTSLPWNLQFRGGQFGARIGRQNPTHLHSWDFAVHPLPNQFLFGSHGIALPGGELSVLLPLPWYVELIGAVQGGDGGSFRTKSAEYGAPTFRDFLYPLRLVQFLDVGDDWGMQLGLNAVFGTSALAPEKNNRTETYGADLLLKWRPIGYGNTGFVYVKWTAEAWMRSMQAPGDLWRDVGGYTDLVFGLGKQWNTRVRGELWRRLRGNSPTEQNRRAAYGLNMEKGSAQVSFLPSHFSRVRAQYSVEHAEQLGFNHTVIMQLEVAAGAHGAHQY